MGFTKNNCPTKMHIGNSRSWDFHFYGRKFFMRKVERRGSVGDCHRRELPVVVARGAKMQPLPESENLNGATE
jgi:hypothetical protein